MQAVVVRQLDAGCFHLQPFGAAEAAEGSDPRRYLFLLPLFSRSLPAFCRSPLRGRPLAGARLAASAAAFSAAASCLAALISSVCNCATLKTPQFLAGGTQMCPSSQHHSGPRGAKMNTTIRLSKPDGHVLCCMKHVFQHSQPGLPAHASCNLGAGGMRPNSCMMWALASSE